jgi:microcystin-dependent protein
MGLLHYLWSRTAGSNATADAQINWAEGMPPSAVNDSARAMMASLAGFRDDIAGAITTGGTSTAFTITSYQIFDTLAHMSGQLIAFTPHATNGATVTLNVDGLGAKPLRSAPSVELPAGVLVQGSPYVALYNNSDAVWYLQGFYINPYQVPLGGMLDYIGSTAPNSAFVLPIGQAISRTTYATLFSLVGTTYGSGDGSTTFNVPDLTGRTTAMKEAVATRLTTAAGGVDGATLGAVGGSQSSTLTLAQLPTGIKVVAPSGNTIPMVGQTGATYGNTGVNTGANTYPFNTTAAGWSYSTELTSNNTSGNAHAIVQPTIIVNKILRVV